MAAPLVRRPGRIYARSAQRSLVTMALPYLLEDAYLCADEVYACECLCVAALQSKSGKSFVRHWLERRGIIYAVAGGWHVQVDLRTDYRTAMYQLQFLREVCLRLPNAVIAGGFAAAQHLFKHSLPTFLPTDIDIFVSPMLNHMQLKGTTSPL